MTAAPTQELVATRLAEVRARIASAGRTPGEVTIVAVTKGFGRYEVEAALAAGLHDFGENYAQELLSKAVPGDAARWHFLGAVQRNKVRALAGRVALWQSVDRMAAGVEIARRAPQASVLVQVNLGGQPHRPGCRWEDASGLVAGLREHGLDVRGLMGVAAGGEARSQFRRLAELRAELALAELSVGMSDDLEIAVEEGATMVRVGRALFGSRPGADRARR